jgi:MFS family permease
MRTNEWGPPPQSQRTNRLAIAALCCGIAVIFFPPTAIVAIILGHIAKREIRRTGEHGRGLATAGLILGYLGLVPLVGLALFAALPLAVPIGAGRLVFVLFAVMAVCLIAVLITLIYRRQRRAGS